MTEPMYIHICNFTDYPDIRHEFEGQICYFDFSTQFGPLFLRGDGEPKKVQPINPNCWSWRAFGDWYDTVSIKQPST